MIKETKQLKNKKTRKFHTGITALVDRSIPGFGILSIHQMISEKAKFSTFKMR